MNPLEQYPRVRRGIYTGMWVAGLALVGAQGWIAGTDAVQPTWLAGALGVFPLAAAYIGFTAQSNTKVPPKA